MNAQALNAARQRIMVAIVKISAATPGQGRAYVDSYLNHVSPTLVTRGDSCFPMSLRRHRTSPDRTQVEGRNYALCFAIGNAIVTYYDAVHYSNSASTSAPETAPANEVNEVLVDETLERRIRLIESIAEFGVKEFVLDGDVRRGYALQRRENAVPAPKPVQAAGSTPPGGGASRVVAK